MRVAVVGLARRPEPFIAQLLDGLTGLGVTVDRHDRPRRRAGRADVVYLPWTATAVEHPEVFALGAPVVVSCRGAQVNVAPWNPDRTALRDGLAAAFGRATAVHCVSNAIRDEATAFGLDPDRAVVIRPAVDLTRFSPTPPPAPDGPLALVSVGRLQWRKGYEYALLAVRRLLDQGVDVRYRIVGEEADGGATRHAVADLGLAPVVTLDPPTDRAGVAAALATTDALVLPSLSEGIANAALEAMASARPVVVTDCGGMTEAVTDGVEGRVVPVRDPDALAAALADLAADPDRRATMGRAGRARVEAHHDLADQVRAFHELLTRVTA